MTGQGGRMDGREALGMTGQEAWDSEVGRTE
jgi:hypothetical protein